MYYVLPPVFFQTPYYWPSQHHTPDNIEYAIYLAKRSQRNKQKHGLEDYEVVRINERERERERKLIAIGKGDSLPTNNSALDTVQCVHTNVTKKKSHAQ